MQNNKVPIAKSINEELKQVTYVAMQPGVDLHGDFVDVDEIRKAKESFYDSPMRTNLFHMTHTDMFRVIESYCIPCDVELSGHKVLKGSWLMTLQVQNEDLWGMIKEDQINGISIGAMAEVENLDE